MRGPLPDPPPSDELILVPLSERYDLTSFDCGPYTYLNDALRLGYALRSASLNRSRTYLLLSGERVAGYFSLEAGVVPTLDMPTALSRRLAGDEPARLPSFLPAIHLAALARDLSFRGKEIGPQLLLNALRRATAASVIVGAAGVFLVAISEAGYSLYRDFTFDDLDGGTWQGYNRMFVPMEDAAEIVAAAS